MVGIQPLAEQVAPFFLVVVRLTGLFIVSPLLGSSSIPLRAKALLAIALAAAVFPSLPEPVRFPPDVTLWAVLPLIGMELLVGFVIGAVASLPVLAAQMGGQLIGYQMGLSIAQSFNPELESNADVMGQLFFFAATAMFVSLGGADAMYSVLIGSFDLVPPGGLRPDGAPLELYLGVLASAMELMLRISAPVVVISMLVLLAMGFITKSMPALNILSVGFAMKIVASVAVLIPAVGIILSLSFGLQEDTVADIRRWALSLGSG